MIGCQNVTSAGLGRGLSPYYCSYHVQHRSRHGSLWHPTYPAADLCPYQKAASRWITKHKGDFHVDQAISLLAASLSSAGDIEIATRLRGLSAHRRARIAFARLRDASIPPERLLGIHLAVCGLMEDDAGTHREREFRIVQVAKAIHRLASGHHQRWDFPLPSGTTAPIILHKYPRSSGQVLRVIGSEVERCCELVTEYHLADVLALKNRLHGPHASRLPGWKPVWRRKLDAARQAAQARHTAR